MYHLLNKKRHELSYNDLKLYKQVVKLRDEMGALSRNNASQQPDLFDQSRHFAFKAQQLMARFKGFAHVTVRKVSIKPLTTGFNHSFDLVIEGEGNHRVFDNFIKYKAPLDELHKDRDALLISIQEAQRNILSLGNVWKNVLPLIKLDTPVNQAKILNEFPQPLHGKIAELFMVIQTARNIEPPADLSTFPEAIHKNFLDRAFLNALDFEQLTPDKINEIKDLSLQNDIRNVFTKLKPPSPEHSLFRRTVNLLLSSFQENEEDLRYQFAVLKTQPNDALRQFFALELSRKTALIGQDLEDLVNAVEDGLTLMKRKLQFIDATIRVEQQNSGVMVKRFASLEQLYEFDDALRVLTKDYVPVVEKEIPKRIAADVAFVDEGVGCGFVFP